MPLLTPEEIRAMDAEADAFAMTLLMPRELLLNDLRRLGGIDIEGGAEQLTKLARKYRVSLTIMTMRIGQLLVSEGAL